MHVIGTAGHVDHGKSSLVRALTGIDPDRLKEEQEREMTIDLGYAWMTLPNGESVSIIDVPGHEDFIRNMLAGVGAIDAAILVVAADDGVMPQTREHVAILDLLQVKTGVVALTKADLVTDADWLDLVREDLREWLSKTSLADFPIIPVSSRTKQGLNELREELGKILAAAPPRADLGKPRLLVDRVFTQSGFGTVVTGTLIDGRLHVGDEVELEPSQLRARIRGLQTHRTKLTTAVPGSRVASNLTGVAVEQIQRGDVVTTPGWLAPTVLLDIRVDVLLDSPKPVKQNMEVALFTGAAELLARLRVIGSQEIAPGESGWAQARLAHPAAVAKRDRFVMRLPSPSITIAGGEIVDPYPQRRHRRFRAEVVQRLETLAHGTPEEIVLTALRRSEPSTAKDLITRTGLPADVAGATLAGLIAGGQVLILGTQANGEQDARSLQSSALPLMTTSGWSAWLDQLVEILDGFHRRSPLRVAMPVEELRSRLGLDLRLCNEMLTLASQQGRVTLGEVGAQLPDHTVKFSPQQEAQIASLLTTFRRNRYLPPTVEEARAVVGNDVLSSLLEQRVLVKVSEDICFLRETYEEIVERVKAFIKQNGSISMAQMRDMLGTTRKYMVPFLEHMDERRITRRMGDERVLR